MSAEAGSESAGAAAAADQVAATTSGGSPAAELGQGRRLRSLVEAGTALVSELSLDRLLGRLVAIAADLTGARYAALGVVEPGGAVLERFVVHGIDPETEAAIGERPRGHGLLGALIHEGRPLRVADLASDPRFEGFPEGHPQMRSFLGVPILLRGVTYGNLYLADKSDGQEFTGEDEELVTLLAGQAAVAIENVRLYEAATRWSARLESLNEVGNALSTETDLETLLDLIARKLRELLQARFVGILLDAGEDELRFAAVAGDAGRELLGRKMRRAGSKSGKVLTGRKSERVDSIIDDPEVDSVVTRNLAPRTGLWVPLVAGGRAIGVIAAHDRLDRPDCRFTQDDLRLAETLASRAAVAVDLSERVARDALRRVVAAQELERRRLARALHDETGQALTSILLGLRGLERLTDPEESRAARAALRDLTVGTLTEVRRLAVDLRPKALDDFGLVPALERLTETWSSQTGIAISLAAHVGDEPLSSEIATALYRIVQESLVSVVKRAEAHRVGILLTRNNGTVTTVIEDDGHHLPAMDDPEIVGMRERVGLLDGRLTIEPGEQAGAAIVVEVPVR